jgi:hypothetical protein
MYMILGMSLETFTAVHVAISLIAIGSGFLVVFGMMASRRLPVLTTTFMVTTALTSITGFMFPFKGVTPAIVLGILSLVTLAIAAVARYARHLGGAWRGTWVITAAIALYFNFFVLIVQSFQKVPALHALAPTQTEGPFKVAQLLVLIVFVAITILAFRRFRSGPSLV